MKSRAAKPSEGARLSVSKPKGMSKKESDALVRARSKERQQRKRERDTVRSRYDQSANYCFELQMKT
jgi:hypothetical protein